jgi:curved DNA-binding protein
MSKSQRDLYALLGVPKTASADEIKKAYRELAKRYHPDRNPGDKAAEERFKEISAAHAVLSDDEKRRRYDDFGPDGLREGFDPDAARNYARWASQSGGRGAGPMGGDPGFGGFGGFSGFGDLNDILGNLFGEMGGGRRGRARSQARGSDVETEVTITLRQAVEGAEVALPELGGTVRVPPGIASGQKVRVSGRGQQGPLGPGDAIVAVRVAAPMGFELDGDDLVLDAPLKLSEAMLGASVQVPTPEGTTLSLKVPAGSQSGQRMRIRGRGMTRKGGERGELYVRLLVRVPRTDDERAAELARALDAYY